MKQSVLNGGNTWEKAARTCKQNSLSQLAGAVVLQLCFVSVVSVVSVVLKLPSPLSLWLLFVVSVPPFGVSYVSVFSSALTISCRSASRYCPAGPSG